MREGEIEVIDADGGERQPSRSSGRGARGGGCFYIGR